MGSAKHFGTRKKSHFRLLKQNKHHSTYLQNAYNKYGKRNFIFVPIDFVKNKELLIPMEQAYLDVWETWDPTKGYNICKFAGSSLGRITTEHTKQLIREKRTLQVFSPESRKKQGESMKGKLAGDKNPMYGKLGEEHPKAKLNPITIDEIRKLRAENKKFYTYKKLGEMFNITRSHICQICLNKLWIKDEKETT